MLESHFHHRSRSVPTSIVLTFASTPTSYTDPIAALQPDDPNNNKFQSFRTWLQTQRSWLVGLHALGVKYADNHRDQLVEKVDYQLERLMRLERDCWDRAKVAAKVPGIYYSEKDGPIVVTPRAFSS